MGEPVVLYGLKAKRAEISGTIREMEKTIRGLKGQRLINAFAVIEDGFGRTVGATVSRRL